MNAPPLVTVILLCYNHASYINKAIQAFENQTYKNFELIVVDDCSNDESVSIINKWAEGTSLSHKILANENNYGICKSINLALQVSRGMYFSVIAADDWAENTFLQEMVEGFGEQNESVAFVYADVREVDRNGSPLGLHSQQLQNDQGQKPIPRNIFDELLVTNLVKAPAVMSRKDYVIDLGSYDESLGFEDYDMWLKLSRFYDSVHLQKILVNYRILESSMSRSEDLFISRKKSELQILEKWTNLSKDKDFIISQRMRNICIELLAKGESTTSLRYLKISNSLNFRFTWMIFRLFVKLKFTRKLVYLLSRRLV